MLQMSRPEALRSQALDEFEGRGIRHGFFTRLGGVSDGIYASLNIGLGSQDERHRVVENRSRVARAMGVEPAHLLTPHQTHSATTVVAAHPWGESRPRADAIVTGKPGLAIAVGTADCGPILLADPEAHVVGAAHAGWKGALEGILESVVEAMEGLGARRQRIVAALGPSISREHYEVGPEFVARWLAADPANAVWFTPSGRQGHAMFDLRGYTLARLQAIGVAASAVEVCTYAREDLFFSYRRSTHRSEADYGRQISVIVLEER
jgi:YfiH family protein